MPVISALLIGIVLVFIFIWYRSRGTDRKVKRLGAELDSLIRRRRMPERNDQYLVKVFNLLQQGIAVANTPVCYQAVDLLKTAYGEGIIRIGELSHIVSLSAMAIREKQYDVAGILTDAARLIVRRQATDQAEGALEQLQLLATVALKEKQNFIAAKAAELIFYILEKTDHRNGMATTLRALAALQAVGVLVIRRRDSFMLREFTSQLIDWYGQSDPVYDTSFAELIAAWLHRSLHSSDTAAFEIICDFIAKITETRSLDCSALRLLVTEVKNMAGTLSMEPGNRAAAMLIRIILEMSYARDNIEESRQAVQAVGEVARMSIHNHDLCAAFPILLPLLDYGRKMLILELKFGGEASAGGHRQRVLFFLIKECLSIFEFTARKRMTDSMADIVDECIYHWQAGPETMHTLKSFRKFCSLLLLYRAANRRSKLSAVSSQAGRLTLFTDKEQERLKVFIGGIQHELLSGAGRKI